MVAQTQFDPQNPDALFSPDQWLNQFSNFNNAALPWPSSYVGMPTDAMGNPIQPPPGMTINNSAPAAPAAPPAAPQPNSAQQMYNAMSGPSAMNPTGNPAFGASNWGFGLGAQGAVDRNSPAYQTNPSGQGQGAATGNAAGGGAAAPGGGMTQAQMMASFTPLQQQWWAGAPASERQQAMTNYGVGRAPAAPAPAAPTGPTYPQILQMLANPGKVTTPGATVPATASAQPGPGSLQAFLQNYKPAASGNGSQFQQGLASTLKGMGYG